MYINNNINNNNNNTYSKPVHTAKLGADVRDLTLSVGEAPGDAAIAHRVR
jgi:hypothetical protein